MSDEAYHAAEAASKKNLNIGRAIAGLKESKRIARKGWNGKGMFLVLVTPGANGEDSLMLEYANDLHIGVSPLPGDAPEMKVQPCIALKTAGNTLQPGWNASTPDLLADDWEILD